MQKRIEDLATASANKWNPSDIRRACAVNFNSWFNSNVKDKARQEFDKAFHTAAQRSAQYKSKGCILDLVDGPVISEEDFLTIQQNPDQVETIDVANTEEDIRELQLLYQRKQFGHDKHLIWRDGVKLHLSSEEIRRTIQDIGKKKKAVSWDNV